ncbi:hypothetical protein SEMRO_5_G003970.1 [Seminavis robusta]|uniref:Uncharacterized protein n=1 Tax=Seminavis robusta TaxID=568900 RepID=A0A9N8H1K6_9STRA|nr:hypothetical protein SEMRO_5_G003970.1 [Seminavis robusta]|eukprot:Sro5_g003970.1 n/a (263) ;mRNA; r:15371-16159
MSMNSNNEAEDLVECHESGNDGGSTSRDNGTGSSIAHQIVRDHAEKRRLEAAAEYARRHAHAVGAHAVDSAEHSHLGESKAKREARASRRADPPGAMAQDVTTRFQEKQNKRTATTCTALASVAKVVAMSLPPVEAVAETSFGQTRFQEKQRKRIAYSAAAGTGAPGTVAAKSFRGLDTISSETKETSFPYYRGGECVHDTISRETGKPVYNTTTTAATAAVLSRVIRAETRTATAEEIDEDSPPSSQQEALIPRAVAERRR